MILLHNNILVKPDTPKPVESKSGIILLAPQEKDEIPNTGVIKGVGPGRPGEPNPYHRKQRIKYDPHIGIEVSVYDEKLLLIDADDVYAVLQEDIDEKEA